MALEPLFLLSELGIFCRGLLHDRDFWVGVLPNCKEILVGPQGLGGVS